MPRTKSKSRRRSPGWIGTRVTVCGHPLPTHGDLICLLYPAHDDTIPHTSMAIGEDGIPVMVIERDTYIQFIEAPNEG